MTLQSGYKLSNLRIVYRSKLRDDLQSSITTLKRTLDWIPTADGMISSFSICIPITGESGEYSMPSRLPRRAWRVWYNKAPHAIGWSKIHYIFHDWGYSFDFKNVKDVKYDIN